MVSMNRKVGKQYAHRTTWESTTLAYTGERDTRRKNLRLAAGMPSTQTNMIANMVKPGSTSNYFMDKNEPYLQTLVNGEITDLICEWYRRRDTLYATSQKWGMSGQ